MKTVLVALVCSMLSLCSITALARESKRPTAKKLFALERRRDIGELRAVLAYHEGEFPLKKLARDLTLTYRGRSGFSLLKRNPPSATSPHSTLSRHSVSDPAFAGHPGLKKLNVAAIGRILKTEAKKITDGPAPREWVRDRADWPAELRP